MTATDHAIGLTTCSEITSTIPLKVDGTLPSYLGTSTLYRVGPGLYDVHHSDGKLFRISHWFDGLSVLHAFYIDSGTNTVSYRNRRLTDSLARSIGSTASDKWNDFSFGPADPCRSLLSRFFQLWTREPVDPHTGEPPRPNVGVTVQTVPGKGIVVRTDTSHNVALDDQSLEIDHFFRFDKLDSSLSGIMSAAHGQFDTRTGEFFNYVYDINAVGQVDYKVFKICKDSSTKVLATVREYPAYIHSFATTENYLVLILWPMRLSSLKMLWTRSVLNASSFHPDIPTKFFVISRKGDGLIASYTARSFFCFHVINAYENGGHIHIDLCRYNDNSVVHDFTLPQMTKSSRLSRATVTRFTLPDVPLTVSKVPGEHLPAEEHEINECDMELPRIHPDRDGKNYRFVYGVSSAHGVFDVVAKVDVQNGTRKTWTEPRSVVGEPIFVPDPDGSEEDHGCLLCVVLDAARKTSRLVVLDAFSMSPVAEAYVGQIVPLGFHGMLHRNALNVAV